MCIARHSPMGSDDLTVFQAESGVTDSNYCDVTTYLIDARHFIKKCNKISIIIPDKQIGIDRKMF